MIWAGGKPIWEVRQPAQSLGAVTVLLRGSNGLAWL